MNFPRFHLAFPVDDLEAARQFYGGVLQCPEGREHRGHWIDFDFHGHQIVAHYAPDDCPGASSLSRERPPSSMPKERKAVSASAVDGHTVPASHFGLILEWSDWEALRDRLVAADSDFIIAPYVRFEGRPGEQATMFVRDPAGNALEFKAFRDDRMVFEKELRETD